VVELGGFEDNTTNNRMELSAIKESLEYIHGHKGFVTIFTDSRYAMQGVQSWMKGWKQNGWQTKNKTDVLNKDLWQAIDEQLEHLMIDWKHVNGHVGVPGNERADTIASTFADTKQFDLYNGSLEDYEVENIFSIEVVQNDVQKKARSSAKAFSYLSLVDGILEKHQTWAECEARVKGIKGAKFRKAISQEEEVEIIRSWGV
jgi:ribonuclease HI